jgi:hypothetical protein
MTNQMACFDALSGEFMFNHEPNHETISMNGIEIDKEIAPIIQSLWSRGITTM